VVGALGIQPAAVQSPHVGGEGAVRGFEDGLVHQPLAVHSALAFIARRRAIAFNLRLAALAFGAGIGRFLGCRRCRLSRRQHFGAAPILPLAPPTLNPDSEAVCRVPLGHQVVARPKPATHPGRQKDSGELQAEALPQRRAACPQGTARWCSLCFPLSQSERGCQRAAVQLRSPQQVRGCVARRQTSCTQPGGPPTQS
jgi:hypothetical protein